MRVAIGDKGLAIATKVFPKQLDSPLRSAIPEISKDILVCSKKLVWLVA
jgi:hypothetical protein